MGQEANHKEPSWINILIFVATFVTLSLMLGAVYTEWKEDRALHSFAQAGHSEIISDITVNLSGTPHQEHCLTCHPQGREVILTSKPPSMKEHPNINPHSIDELGCTGCHLGEGMARDLVISHGVPGMGARKVLAGEDLQASCYRCHELKLLAGAKKAWDGFQVFSQNACDTCHNIDGLEGSMGGGGYGPDLTQVGSFLGLKQIQGSIENPKANLENSIMPKFPLSPSQIKSISYFLKSRVGEPFNETPMVKKARIKEQALVRAKEKRKIPVLTKDLLRKKKCLACHKFREEDGQIGPDLTFIGYMREEVYIQNFLDNPGKEIPGAIMPWVSMTKEEEKKIVRSLHEKNEEYPLQGMEAKHLYMELCQRCHAAQGDGFGIIQPNLANFPRAFWKNAEFFKRIPDERILKSIEKGIPGTSMPPHGELLGQKAIDSLINLLFHDFVRINRDDKRYDLIAPPRPVITLTREKREKVYLKYCSSCHGVAGNGKGPEYLKYLPRPRDLTNHPYFESLTDDRIARAIAYGIPGTAMPPFGEKIPAEGIWSLVKKIREFSVTYEQTVRSS